MTNSRTLRFRRPHSIICYWESGRLVFHNFASQTRIAAEPITAAILEFCGSWRSYRALAHRFAEFTPDSLRRTVLQLAAHGMLQRSDRAPSPLEAALARATAKNRAPGWQGWHPRATFFHLATRDEPYETDLRASRRRLLRLARQHPMPEPVKHYPGARKIALPPPQHNGELPRVLMARRTWREFSSRPLQFAELATLLGLTWRIQRWEKVPGFGRRALKTSPSGGGLHPLEVYVAARNVRGLSPGLYHYSADQHRLELVRRGANSRQLVEYLGRQRWAGRAAALFLMTAVFSREQWKYQSPRAYRVLLAEAGHFCQTFCLMATWLGLAPFCSMALADSRIERDLKIDGVSEAVLYAAGVGTRAARG